MKGLFNWLFRRKQPAPKVPITQEQLERRAVQSVVEVIATRPIPDGQHELRDRKGEAMKIFMTDNPYQMRPKHLVRAKKIIDQHEPLFRSGRFI